MRFFGAVAAIVLITLAARSIPLIAQAGPVLEPVLAFDVVSVKPNPSRTRAPMQWQPGGRFVMGLPIFSLVSIGYLVPGYRIEGLPDWARTTLFDINAQAGRQPEIEERPAYYRGLLVDRFKLVAHIDRREMDVYRLTLARSDGRLGPGLRRSAVNCDEIIAANRKQNMAGQRPEAPAPGVRPSCGAVGGAMSMTAGAAELTPLIGMLAGALERPVLDQTGLTGRFDFEFRAAPPRAGPGVAGTAPAELPPVFTALEDQLGLRLTAGRAPVEVLVIDHLEMPTAN